MGALNVPPEWIENHMRLASRLATVIAAQFLRSESTSSSAIHYAAFLTEAEWQKAAFTAGKTDGYSPSIATRQMVLETLRDREQKTCPDCNLRQASREDRRMIVEGVEICAPCHERKYRNAPAVQAVHS